MTTIEEKNKVIALFDGWTIEPGMEYKSTPWFIRGFNGLWLTDLEYHESWALLMSVVKKIARMKHDPKEMFMGTTLERHIEFSNVIELPIKSTIAAVHEAVYQFCLWYNQLNKQHG